MHNVRSYEIPSPPHKMLTACLWNVHNMFMPFLRHAQDMLWTCGEYVVNMWWTCCCEHDMNILMNMFTTFSPHVHHMFTTRSPNVHHKFATCVHHMFTTRSPNVHRMFTTCSPQVLHMFTTSSQHVYHRLPSTLLWTMIVLVLNHFTLLNLCIKISIKKP